MKKSILTEQHLRKELDYFRERFPKLADNELFLLWFLRAYVTQSEELAASALTGVQNDKGVDAVLLDDTSRVVFIVQGKYRKKFNTKSESRADVVSFADLSSSLTSKNGEFANLIKNMDPLVRQRLTDAHERVNRRGYRLHLYYVTSGKCSTGLRDEVYHLVKRNNHQASIDVFDGHRVFLVLEDYLADVAPPVPSLDLEMEAGQGVQVNGILQRFDSRTEIESWVFSMSGQAVADVYGETGPRLFARNVRGFLGNKGINKGMESTIENEPEYFWYYNNGITIICDHAERVSSSGRDILRVANPQIINGQQTTRMLHRQGAKASKASVVVRVIRVPRDRRIDLDNFETLVSRIVAATNWQNAILQSDLMSNDRRQIEIERQLRKLNYCYVRKRQTKSEARRAFGVRHYILVQKEEFARAVAACDMDPSVVRNEGKEGLFEKQYYHQVFPTADPNYYLPRYWLMREVGYAAAGYPERAYAKWLVLNYVWSHVAPMVRSRSGSECFRLESERDGSSPDKLNKVIVIAFKAALAFYRKKRGKGAKATDVSTFFKRKNLGHEFARFWASQANKRRAPFYKAWKRYDRAFRQAMEE